MRLPGGTVSTSYQQELAIVRTRLQWILLISFIALVVAFPWFSSYYLLRVVSGIGITIVAVLGLNILTGYCGQISLGHAAFVGVGAYISAILTTKLGISFWLALPCAGVGAALIGVLFGLPALRVKGLYLALATLAAHYVIMYVISHASTITGGTAGIRAPRPTFLGVSLEPLKYYYYVILAVTILMTLFSRNFMRTKIGRAFVAIRDNDKAAEIMGINLYTYKLLAFALGCFYAGIAGSLWAHYIGVIDPDHFLLTHSIWYVGMLIVGGMGSTAGVFFGVIFLRLIDVLATEIGPIIADAVPVVSAGIAASLAQMVFGLIIILFLVFEPRGLAHRWQLFKAWYRIWPFPY